MRARAVYHHTNPIGPRRMPSTLSWFIQNNLQNFNHQTHAIIMP